MGTTAQEFGNSHVTHDFAMCYNIAQQILHSNTILMNWLLSNYTCPMSLPQMYASGCLSNYPVGDGDFKHDLVILEKRHLSPAVNSWATLRGEACISPP